MQSILPKVNPITTQRFNGSDPSTWVELHGDALFHYAKIRVRDRAIAEEIVQETFLAALQAKKTFEGQATERSWMIGILKNKIVDHYRQKARDQRQDYASKQSEFTTLYFDNHGHWMSRIHSWPAESCESLSNQDFWHVLDECTAKLPDSVLAAFTLRDVEGMDTSKICNILNITATNLGARLHRARILLRQCLEQNWFITGKTKG